MDDHVVQGDIVSVLRAASTRHPDGHQFQSLLRHENSDVVVYTMRAQASTVKNRKPDAFARFMRDAEPP